MTATRLMDISVIAGLVVLFVLSLICHDLSKHRDDSLDSLLDRITLLERKVDAESSKSQAPCTHEWTVKNSCEVDQFVCLKCKSKKSVGIDYMVFYLGTHANEIVEGSRK